MDDEDAAMDQWNVAWQRYRDAMSELNSDFRPRGSGVIPAKVLEEVDAAKMATESAKAEIDRIVSEIRSGIRR